jgi:hypothetical protein
MDFLTVRALAVAGGVASAEGTANSLMGDILSYTELISVVLLTVGTFGLWFVTAQVHRDEVTKMTASMTSANDNMADANDNITDVALAEIGAHHRNTTRMRRLSAARREARRARRLR